MLTPMVAFNYLVALVAIVVSLHTLWHTGWRSLIGMMTLLFVVLHMAGAYWVPDEIRLYQHFDERVFDLMLGYHAIGALILTAGCLLQPRFTAMSRQKAGASLPLLAAVFLLSLLVTSLPVAILMAGAFLVLRWGNGPPIERSDGASTAGEARSGGLWSPLGIVIMIGSMAVVAYDLVFSSGLDDLRATLQYGFGSASDYMKYRVGEDFTPSFLASQVDTVKTSLAPAVSLLLLSAFLRRRSWSRLGLLVALVGLVGLTRLASFTKSGLAVYAVQLAIAYVALRWIGRRAEVSTLRALFSSGFRLAIGGAASAATLFWMYSFSRFSDSVWDALEQMSRRLFLIPYQGAYAWFSVFPGLMDFVGFSRSRIVSLVLGVSDANTGYLPYTVSVLATGTMFGLNTNFIATGWAYWGAAGLILTVQLTIGTLFVERWLRGLRDAYVYWPAYAFAYGSLGVAVTVPFDALVVVYGLWLVPIPFCIAARPMRLFVIRLRPHSSEALVSATSRWD